MPQFHTTPPPIPPTQTFTVPSGRTLSYSTLGSPTGHPLLYFHGYPSSRLEATPLHPLFHRLNIRVFALDRPGFGLSTPQPHRTILDWPSDVAAFAAGMDLTRFAVLGVSGGGPYALACACKLSRGMLSGVGLFASAGPWAAGPQHVEVYRRGLAVAARWWPWGLRVVMDGLVGVVRWLVRRRWVTRRIDAWLEAGTRRRKEGGEGGALFDEAPKRTTAQRRQDLLCMLIGEPFAQGAGAAVHEARLLSSPHWGFRFEDVQYDAVRIWHGVQDRNSPISMIRYLAERLPHCVLREFKGDTHYTMFKHLEGTLTELVSAAEDTD